MLNLSNVSKEVFGIESIVSITDDFNTCYECSFEYNGETVTLQTNKRYSNAVAISGDKSESSNCIHDAASKLKFALDYVHVDSDDISCFLKPCTTYNH